MGVIKVILGAADVLSVEEGDGGVLCGWGQGPGEGWASAGRLPEGVGRGAYLDKQQSCCKVSALATAHYTGCCRRTTHRNECDSASPPHMWQNTHSTLTTPHLELSLLRRRRVGKGWDHRKKREGRGEERAITN